MSENALVAVPQRQGELSVVDVRSRAALIRQVLDEVMVEGHHYGQVPGTKGAPVLLKAGAEKLAMVFRLAPRFDVVAKELPGGHREYLVTCEMHNQAGDLLGSGVGSCSTMESKYRYRWKGEGKGRTRAENPDIADTYNTVLKMAKKRAQVDATLTVTGASDIFAPDPVDDGDDQQDEHPKPTEHEQLVFECGDLHRRLGGDAAKIAGVCAEAGVQPGKRLADRTVEELRKIRDALAREANLGGPQK